MKCDSIENIKQKMITEFEIQIGDIFSDFDERNPSKTLKRLNYFKKCLKTFRLDIKNEGYTENDITIIGDSNKYRVSSPEWFNDERGVGYQIESKYDRISVEFRCIKEGNLNLNFRSVDYRNSNNRRVQIHIILNKLSFNKECIVTENQLICHDRPYFFQQKCDDDETVELIAEFKSIYDYYPKLEVLMDIKNVSNLKSLYEILMTYIQIEKLALKLNV